jgi:hypothetical protein
MHNRHRRQLALGVPQQAHNEEAEERAFCGLCGFG